ncbi:mRNA surveillance protein pelota [Ignisphaera sp. 4213-co]|uniref:Protein pelota homolog n=1 Tax=Ignisphaera cupida TaxID=3050454 RepID=A0ABD4Z8N7_9CREN|nr:mRNA surveillance protein pelota [Ignisphaera sp. 4213-co]MDK6029265.1 mRNA surveillance protein pelota [Ignisphaera sp. 4213-co]
MKLEVLDYRDGVLRVRIDGLDDLWILSMLVSKGDVIKARTTRDVSIGDEKRRIPMTLAIRVEKTEFQPFTNRLRIHGIVVEGPDRFGVKGSHHTISVGVGDEIVIQKVSWDPKLVEEILKIVRPLNILLVAVDFDEYAIALLQLQGMKIIDSENVSLPLSDESFEVAEKELVSELTRKIVDSAHRYGVEAVVIASPGSLKNKIRDAVVLLDSKIRIFLDTVANGGYAGLQELLNRDVLSSIIRDTAIAKASEVIDEFDRLLVKDINMVAYGMDSVSLAAELGAVKKLAIVDEMLSSFDETRYKVEKMLRDVVNKGGDMVIVPSNTPVGQRIKMLGGVIAILRYPLELDFLGNQ